MNGLYALKPWYATRLGGVRRVLVERRVSPTAVTAAGVVFGAATGAVLFFLSPGPATATIVGILLAGRLACANLDGGVARESGRANRFGAVVNELGDRLGELAAIAGLAAMAPPGLVLAAAFAASTPSWVSLAGAAAGALRLNGGPAGKTERCAVLVVIAATGWAVPLLVVIGAGSAATVVYRLVRLRRLLAAS